MIKLDCDILKQLQETQLCAEHQERVTLVWHDKEACHTLRCARGEYPDALVRIPTTAEEFKQGKLGEDTATRRAKEFAKNLPTPGTKLAVKPDLGMLPVADLETGELLTPEAIQALVDYAHRYELDPYRGHVVLMHGKPYISLDGYLYHANQTNVPFTLKSRPLTDDERKTYQVPEGAHAWVSEVIKSLSGTSFIGLGIVTREEMTEMSKRKPGQLRSPVVAAHPWQMAQKRAEWQGMKRAFPIGREEEPDTESRVKKKETDAS